MGAKSERNGSDISAQWEVLQSSISERNGSETKAQHLSASGSNMSALGATSEGAQHQRATTERMEAKSERNQRAMGDMSERNGRALRRALRSAAAGK